MRRVLLVPTAILGLAGLPALAQQQAEPPPPPAAAPGTGAAPAEALEPMPEQAEHQVRAESLLGVGGFLGVGQKSVALAWDSIELAEQDGERVILVAATREQLEGMPEFTTLEEKQAEEAMRQQQQQMQQQQQPGGAPAGVGVAPPAPAPAPAPGNQ